MDQATGSLDEDARERLTRQWGVPADGFVSWTRWLTAFVGDTTLTLVEGGALLRSRQLDMGDSG